MIQPLNDKHWQKPRRKRHDPELTVNGLNARIKLLEAKSERLERIVARLTKSVIVSSGDEPIYQDLDIDLETGRFFHSIEQTKKGGGG